MIVADVIAWLESEIGRESNAGVEVIPIAANATEQRIPVPVLGLSVDPSDGEVHLLVNEAPWEKGAGDKWPLTVGHLLSELKSLDDVTRGFKLVSGTWLEVDADHLARRDWPFDGIATNDDNTAVAFVERP